MKPAIEKQQSCNMFWRGETGG